MNAKELIKASEFVKDEIGDSDLFEGSFESETLKLCEHILYTVREDDDEPIDKDTVLSLGGLPDGEPDNGDYGITIWQKDESEITFDNLEPRSHIVWNSIDGSVFLETYDKAGVTLAVMELAIKNRGQLRRILKELKGE